MESRQTRTDVRVPMVEKISNSCPSATSGWRSPTYSDAGTGTGTGTVGGTAIQSNRNRNKRKTKEAEFLFDEMPQSKRGTKKELFCVWNEDAGVMLRGWGFWLSSWLILNRQRRRKAWGVSSDQVQLTHLSRCVVCEPGLNRKGRLNPSRVQLLKCPNPKPKP